MWLSVLILYNKEKQNPLFFPIWETRRSNFLLTNWLNRVQQTKPCSFINKWEHKSYSEWLEICLPCETSVNLYCCTTAFQNPNQKPYLCDRINSSLYLYYGSLPYITRTRQLTYKASAVLWNVEQEQSQWLRQHTTLHLHLMAAS